MLNPHNMSRSEMMYTLKRMLSAQNRATIRSFKEQWDLPDEALEGYSISDPFIKDTLMVQFKSSNTKFAKLYYEEIYEMFRLDEIKPLDVGYLILLANFIDFQDNSIKNEDGTYMSKSDMKKALKASESTVERFVQRMIEQKIMFCKKNPADKKRRKNRYYINPHIIFKGKQIDKRVKEWLSDVEKERKELRRKRKEDKNIHIPFEDVTDEMIDELKKIDYSELDDEELDIIMDELYHDIMTDSLSDTQPQLQ